MRRLTGGWILVLVLISACGVTYQKPPAPPPEPDEILWTEEAYAIELLLKADRDLNWYDERPHTTSVCIYQLSSSNQFKSLAETRDGLLKLLECKSFDESVAGALRAIVRPKEGKKLVLDRRLGAQWVGVVVGYYDVSPGKLTQIIPVPVHTERKGLPFFKKTVAKPGLLKATVMMGPDSLEESENDE